MDRKVLIELLKEGMEIPSGKHRLWISRCFEITVRPNRVVELNEYESFSSEKGDGPLQKAPQEPARSDREMFHVGRSILHLEEGKVVEESGTGWSKKTSKKA